MGDQHAKLEAQVGYLSEVAREMDEYVTRLIVILSDNFPTMSPALYEHMRQWEALKGEVNSEFDAVNLWGNETEGADKHGETPVQSR